RRDARPTRDPPRSPSALARAREGAHIEPGPAASLRDRLPRPRVGDLGAPRPAPGRARVAALAARGAGRAPRQGLLRRGRGPSRRGLERRVARTPRGGHARPTRRRSAPRPAAARRGGRVRGRARAALRRGRDPRPAPPARQGRSRRAGPTGRLRHDRIVPRRPRSRRRVRRRDGRPRAPLRPQAPLQVRGPAAPSQLRLPRHLMGLFTGLLTLPLAPIRGTIWIAERLAEQAALELDEERQARSLLAEAELRHELGELSDDELEQIEDELLERLQQIGELDAADWRA